MSYDAIAQKYNAINVQKNQTLTPQLQNNNKKPGFVQSIVQSVAKPFLKTATAGIRSAQSAFGFAVGDKKLQNKVYEDMDFGYFGTIDPKTMQHKDFGSFTKDISGTGLEIASNFVGGGGAAKGATQLAKGTLNQAIKTGVKTGMQVGALSSAGTSLQEQKSLGETAFNTAIGTGLGAGIGALTGVAGVVAKTAVTPMKTVIENISPVFKNAAIKIETALIKPVNREMEKGFNANNVFKYKLGGTLEQSYNKITTTLKNLRRQATAMRDVSKTPINLKQVMEDTVAELEINKFGMFGSRQKIDNAVEMFVKEIEMLSPRGYASNPQAQEIKEAVGTLGSWLYGSRDLEANATEKVANVFYTKLKETIEKNSPDGLREINRIMGELIPIKNSIIRRIPIEQRNNVVSLSDIISAGFALQNPKSWGLFILNRLSKSGGFAEKLYNTGAKLESGAKKLLPVEEDAWNYAKNIKPGLTAKDVSKNANPAVSKTADLYSQARKMSKEEFISLPRIKSEQVNKINQLVKENPKSLIYATVKGRKFILDDVKNIEADFNDVPTTLRAKNDFRTVKDYIVNFNDGTYDKFRDPVFSLSDDFQSQLSSIWDEANKKK